MVAALVFLAIAGATYFWLNNEPNWYVEENAVQSASHPLAGFWKEEGCNDAWGWAIGPVEPKIYYISFCGPGGCFKEGTYRPNTTLVDDPLYKIVDDNTILFKSNGDWSKHVRCSGR